MLARLVGFAMFAAWLLAQPVAAQLPVVPGEPAVTAKVASVPHLRLAHAKASVAWLTFNDADNGTFAYTVRGVSGSKAIRRQPF